MCDENLPNFDTADICKRWGFINVYLYSNTSTFRIETVLSLQLVYLLATLQELICKKPSVLMFQRWQQYYVGVVEGQFCLGKLQSSIGWIKCENTLSGPLYCLILQTGVLRVNKNMFTACILCHTGTVSAVKSEKTCGHLCKMLIDFLLYFAAWFIYCRYSRLHVPCILDVPRGLWHASGESALF
jgi:hypothetical protein